MHGYFLSTFKLDTLFCLFEYLYSMSKGHIHVEKSHFWRFLWIYDPEKTFQAHDDPTEKLMIIW